MPTIIADIKKIPEETLREFLYLAIFVPEGEKAPENEEAKKEDTDNQSNEDLK